MLSMLSTICPALRSLVRNESGATMIEYGLIAALVAVAAAGALTALSGDLQTLFQTTIGGSLNGAGG